MSVSTRQSVAKRPGHVRLGLVSTVLAVVLAVPFAIPSEPREDLSRPIETDQVKAARAAAR